jgi:uncharacterized protein (DUF1684 family)
MITAEEFMLENLQSMDQQEVENAMIEFARMHVEAALKAASENAETKFVPFTDDEEIDRVSILDAYPLENIM